MPFPYFFCQLLFYTKEYFVSKKTKYISKTDINDFAYTTIDKIVFCGKEYSVRNWSEALIAITELVIKDKNITPSMLVNSKNLKGKKRDYFSIDYSTMKRAYKLSNGCFLELNFSAKDIYKISHLVSIEFGYSDSDLEIHFSKKNRHLQDNEAASLENNREIDVNEISEEAYDDPIRMLKEIEHL